MSSVQDSPKLLARPVTYSAMLSLGPLLTAAILGTSAGAVEHPLDCEPVHQLRIYEVPAQNEQVFHDRFRDHAAPIMARYGFNILAMWSSEFEDATEFVYLLRWPNVETMQARWAEFMADEEWAQIKVETSAEHGVFVNNIEDRMLCLTDYSPNAID